MIYADGSVRLALCDHGFFAIEKKVQSYRYQLWGSDEVGLKVALELEHAQFLKKSMLDRYVLV